VPAPLVPVDAEHPQPRVLERAVESLTAGELLAYPTDSCYALGCDARARRAVEWLYALKARDRRKPFALLVADLSDVARYAIVSNFAYRVLRQHTPGPFTFVLPATRLVPELLLNRQKQVGIRVPEAPVAAGLARALQGPLVTTTATGADGEPLADPRDIKERYGHALGMVLDVGLQLGQPSTVVSLLGDEIEILRQGEGVLGVHA
jgi:tRNA threonylcarbamoyl adenosine modification protein (Sua5/YciO/YrdC/YwlC family)